MDTLMKYPELVQGQCDKAEGGPHKDGSGCGNDMRRELTKTLQIKKKKLCIKQEMRRMENKIIYKQKNKEVKEEKVTR